MEFGIVFIISSIFDFFISVYNSFKGYSSFEGNFGMLDSFLDGLNGFDDSFGRLDFVDKFKVFDGILILFQMHFDVGTIPIEVRVFEFDILFLNYL